MGFCNVLHLITSTLSALVYEGCGSILRLTADITAEPILVEVQNQGRVYSCGGPEVIKIFRSLSVTTNLGNDSHFLFLFL
jgi:hypothetical protein